MHQLYALGAMAAVAVFYQALVSLPTLLGDAGPDRDAIYALVKTNSADVKVALETGVRHCVGGEYYTKAPQYLQEAAVAAYLSTMRIPGVPSGTPPTDEAFRAQMKERIEVSWKSYAKAVKDRIGEDESNFFSAIRSLHEGNQKVDSCVFGKANEILTQKGLIKPS
jgi:hypothetical protein